MNVKTSLSRMFWGLFFLASAGVLVASKMGWLSFTIGFWPWLASLILGAAALKGLFDLSAPVVVFALAFLGMVWAKPLGIEPLVPWTLLGGATLLSIGLGLILAPLHKKRRPHLTIISKGGRKIEVGGGEQRFTDSASTTHDDQVDVAVRMGSAVRYIQSDNFEHASISVTMGDAKVYFDEAHITADHATIDIQGSMGDVSLYVPRDWRIESHLNAFIGDLEEKGVTPTGTGPTVYLTGDFKIGDVTIHYI
ncbi:LiaF domain-containing protein [Lacticaseibacillus kribbianus]|uniref:LiaF domain-containing protein n=1 Tax=Lacticaseibacillus kribbianus TaxID=2926292 RepID=UPI001CD35E58|nr:LiaF domain-containing protein [Lacticaseibacillus kribbianus]